MPVLPDADLLIGEDTLKFLQILLNHQMNNCKKNGKSSCPKDYYAFCKA